MEYFYSIKMWKKTDVSWNVNTVQIDLSTTNSTFNWTDQDPQFLFRWRAYTTISEDGGYDLDTLVRKSFIHSIKKDGNDYVDTKNISLT